MDKLQKNILLIIKSALTNDIAKTDSDFNWEKAMQIVSAHNVDVLFRFGIVASGLNVPSDINMQFMKRVGLMAIIQARQENEIKKVYKLFNRNNIDFMPLKGSVIKNYYPNAEMRNMGDIDVLIKSAQYDRIKNIMNEMNYDYITESDHEYIWNKKNTLHLELHKKLIPSYNKDYYEYYGDGWKLAKCICENEYQMSDEDFFVYIFTHLAKHYRDSGIGLKHFIDIWVYLDVKQKLDKEYIERELKKLRLLDFYKNSIKMLDVWFNNAEIDKVSEFMTNWIFECGIYGTAENNQLSTALKRSTSFHGTKSYQIQYYICRTFVPYKLMCKKYPILNELPILLPVMWMVRIVDAILFKRNAIKNNNKMMAQLTKEKIDTFQANLNLVGLNFNFKE